MQDGTIDTLTLLSSQVYILLSHMPARDRSAFLCMIIPILLSACGGGNGKYSPPPTPSGNPVPSISSIAPQNVPAGHIDFQLTVNGAGFISGSVVRWNGTNLATIVATDSQLEVTVPSANVASVGTAQVTVFNPTPGGGESAPAVFTITPATNAVPTLSLFSPSPLIAGGATLTLTLAGADFLSGSLVQWNGNNASTTFVSSTQLQTEVNDFAVLYPGTAQLDVFNGPPGGGTSAVLPVSIVPGGTPAGALDVVSAAADGSPGNRENLHPSMSPDGRFIAFESLSFNLVSNAANGHSQIYVRDTCSGVSQGCTASIALVSVASDGTAASSDCYFPSISPDGRFVAFESSSTNLTANSNGAMQVFLHDRDVGGTGVFDQPGNISNVLVSVATNGIVADLGAEQPAVNSDGRYVAFQSASDDLVSDDTNSATDVFLRDTCENASSGCSPSTIRISVASDGTQADGLYSQNASLSADGRFVAFESTATNLAPGFTGGGVFIRDTCLSAPVGCTPSTIGVSVTSTGAPAFGAAASISSDGRFVAFVSGNLISHDGIQDVYLRDTCEGAPATCQPSTRQISIGAGGQQPSDGSYVPSISATGRFVGFKSAATNLAANNVNDTNDDPDFFVYDTCLGAPSGCTPKALQVSIGNDGTQAQGDQGVDYPSIRVGSTGVVIFQSSAKNLLPSPGSTEPEIYRVVPIF